MKKIILTASLTLMLAACASTGTTSMTADDANKAIASAEAAQTKAAAVGYEWRDTGKIIKSAKTAAEAKEYEKAITLAKKAEQQGINAVKQHDAQVAALSN